MKFSYILRWIRWFFTGTKFGNIRRWRYDNGNLIGPNMTRQEAEK